MGGLDVASHTLTGTRAGSAAPRWSMARLSCPPEGSCGHCLAAMKAFLDDTYQSKVDAVIEWSVSSDNVICLCGMVLLTLPYVCFLFLTCGLGILAADALRIAVWAVGA